MIMDIVYLEFPQSSVDQEARKRPRQPMQPKRARNHQLLLSQRLKLTKMREMKELWKKLLPRRLLKQTQVQNQEKLNWHRSVHRDQTSQVLQLQPSQMLTNALTLIFHQIKN